MKRSNIFQLLVKEAALAHRTNQGRLGESQRQLEGSKQTRDMLSEYRSRQQKGLVAGKTLANHELTVRNRFIEKLNLALTQQSGMVARHEATVTANQSLLRTSAVRLRSIERLISRRHIRQAQQDQTTAQKQTDEQSALIFARRNQS